MAEPLDLTALPDPAPVGAVLVLRSDFDADRLHAMATAILDHYQDRGLFPLLVHLGPGETLEVLDEEQMRASGWVRS